MPELEYDAEGFPNGRECDECGRVELHDDCSPYDWVNGVCEICDPTILTLPENAWRLELAHG
ncbi:MAG: hypothetical protein LC650_00650 [Actinobacteria bacterium]|nr:hypothetical protein [Actinomycetota bacterium]